MGEQVDAPRGRRWLPALVTAAAGVAVAAAVARLPAIGPERVPWWGLAALAVATELLADRVRRRGEAVAGAPGQLVVVAGLYLAAPLVLLLARLAGVMLAGLLAGRGRPGPARLVATAGRRLLTTALVVLALRVLAAGVNPHRPAGWAVVVAACALAELAGLGAAALGRRFSGAAPEPAGWALGLAATVLVANLGLLAVTTLRLEPAALLLVLVPLGLAAAALATYGRWRPRGDGIAVLYEAMRRLQEAGQVDDLLVSLAAQLRDEFRAEAAEIVLLAEGPGRPATWVAIAPGAERGERAAAELDPDQAVWAEALASGRTVRLSAGGHGLATSVVTDALVAPMMGPAGPVGVLAVLNRVGDGRFGAEDEELLGALARHVAISVENARLVGDLHHQASHDPLTGLLNRTALAGRVATGLGRPGWLAMLFIDLDGFKAVNDRLGHAAGDQLLVAASRRLRSALRPGDALLRFAGDEFVVVSEDLPDERAAGLVADRLLAALARPFALDAGEARVMASIGIAMARGPAPGSQLGGADPAPQVQALAEALLQRADAAMYLAKQAGKGRWELAR